MNNNLITKTTKGYILNLHEIKTDFDNPKIFSPFIYLATKSGFVTLFQYFSKLKSMHRVEKRFIKEKVSDVFIKNKKGYDRLILKEENQFKKIISESIYYFRIMEEQEQQEDISDEKLINSFIDNVFNNKIDKKIFINSSDDILKDISKDVYENAFYTAYYYFDNNINSDSADIIKQVLNKNKMKSGMFFNGEIEENRFIENLIKDYYIELIKKIETYRKNTNENFLDIDTIKTANTFIKEQQSAHFIEGRQLFIGNVLNPVKNGMMLNLHNKKTEISIVEQKIKKHISEKENISYDNFNPYKQTMEDISYEL